MARMLTSFNAKESDKMGDFTPIPAGIYSAQIVKSEMKETKDKDGHYLSLQFQIMDGEYNGRFIFERLNLQNKNVQTVEIAQKALATICECAGVDILDDSEQLHNKPMSIKVVVKPARAQYAEQNEIKGFESIDGAISKAASEGVASLPKKDQMKETPSASTESPTKKTPPWKK